MQILSQINALSVSLMSRLVLPSMEKRGRGAILNMGSASMVNPLPLMASYAASKAYVSYLSEALVSSVRLGYVNVTLHPGEITQPSSLALCIIIIIHPRRVTSTQGAA